MTPTPVPARSLADLMADFVEWNDSEGNPDYWMDCSPHKASVYCPETGLSAEVRFPTWTDPETALRCALGEFMQAVQDTALCATEAAQLSEQFNALTVGA